MKTILVQISIIALLLGSAGAIAQNDPMKDVGDQAKPSQNDAAFDELDLNKDGYLTKEEVAGNPTVAQDFARLDKDGDGRISLDEWKMGEQGEK